jgi:site-specific recombinase XerD
MTLQPITPAPAALQELQQNAESAREYAENARAENTRRAYRSDWRQFEAWNIARNLTALPAAPATIGRYLADMADMGKKPATIQRRLVAIAYAHRLAGYDLDTRHPAIREVFAGIRRKKGTAQVQKRALLTEDVRAMARALPSNAIGARDRALLLLGFAGALRRSELVALNVEDIEHQQAGIVLHIRRSKTDQDGEGQEIAIPYGQHEATCPVLALQTWLGAACIASGPVFRAVDRHGNISPSRLTDRAVALVVKRAATAAGLDPANYAGHSLRSGMATSAARAGADERSIMNQTRHRSVAMVRRYIQRGQLFADNAAGCLGL